MGKYLDIVRKFEARQTERHEPFAVPDIHSEDIAAVTAVLSSGRLTQGPQVEAFEAEFAEYVGTRYAVAVSSCWAALHLAYMAIGLERGSLVTCPALSHVATAGAIEAVGAKPLFIDCDLTTGNVFGPWPAVDAHSLVHYAGISCELIGASFLVEDCALALGARFLGVHVGQTIGCFSFYPAKHITTGEGGMLTTNSKEIAEKVRQLRSFGYGNRTGKVYDVPVLGYNYRMTEMAAALGRGQLRRFPQRFAQRKYNWERLCSAVKKCGLFVIGDEANEQAYYCLTAILPDRVDRNRFLTYMKGVGIELSVYYPHPIPRLAYFQQKYGPYAPDSFPNAERIADHSVSFPVGPHLNEVHMAVMADHTRRFLEKVE